MGAPKLYWTELNRPTQAIAVAATPTYGLSRAERLRGKSADMLFKGSKGGFMFPYRFVYKVRPAEADDKAAVAVLFSVPKRNIKRAVGRNLLKRRSREAYRLNKLAIVDRATEKGVHIDIALIYSHKEPLEYTQLNNAVQNILAKICRGL